jgi:hypothetical protein
MWQFMLESMQMIWLSAYLGPALLRTTGDNEMMKK